MKLVFGAVRFDGGSLLPDIARNMASAMTPPGLTPALSLWTDSHAALGTLDFHPRQPESSPELTLRKSGHVLTCDLRLDEPDELAARLSCSPATTPRRLVESVLDRDGPDGLKTLLGDFALAQWNPGRRELMLARDGMGIRPLVYMHAPGKMAVFASFPRAIHASGLVERRLDHAALIRQMLSVSLDTDTLFEGVVSVRRGAYLILTEKGATETVYWRPTLRNGVYRTPEEGAEALRSSVEQAVKSRIAGDGPVATHLSGGLDSSAIAVLTARDLETQGRRLLAYQFLQESAPGMDDDPERPYVRAVLHQQPSIEFFPLPQSGFSIDDPLKLDRILSDSPLDLENQACAQASASGAQTILSGWGGDEGATFNGRGALAGAFLSGRWTYLWQEINGLKAKRGFSSRQILHGEILTYLRQELAGRLRRPEPNLETQMMGLIRPEVLRAALGPVPGSLRIGSRARINQLRLISGRHLEFRAANWAEIGAAYGIAVAFPMLDRRVIECALAMPGFWYLRGGIKRRPFRDAMQGILPEVIRRRHDKLTPFPSAMRRLIERREDLLIRIEAMLQRPAFDALFDAAAVRRMLRQTPSLAAMRQSPEAQMYLLPYLPLLASGMFLTREETG